LCVEKNQRFLLNFGALCPLSKSVFKFFPVNQVLEIILNESSKNTEMPLLSGFQKLTEGILRNQVYMVSWVLSLVFKTGMFLGHLVYLKSVK
jgi:hypothetical protein